MGDFLIESGLRAFRPTLVTNMMGYNTKYEHDIQVMADLANESAHYVSCDSVYSTATVHLSSHLR